MPTSITPPSPLDRARGKAYRRLLPLLFLCYVIAYVDRNNVGLAKLYMIGDLPGFNDKVIGWGAGFWFFVGYLLLEIPGTLLVEKWSARKWICRIMVTWGLVAALTAAVKTPWQFYGVRFLLGLAEAGFFPGVIVFLTHWFPNRDRSRALSWFLIATPIAQFISPKISYYLLRIGTDERIGDQVFHHPLILGLKGWQWMYIGWGIPSILLGLFVLVFLTDRPGQARWLDPEERKALEEVLEHEKSMRRAGRHMSLREALGHPKVLLLTAAYFFIVTGNYGVEFFLPSMLKEWYRPSDNLLTWVLMIPPLGSLFGQLFVGWNSDRTKERRLHTAVPIYLGGLALALTLFRGQPLWFMICLFTVAAMGLKAYLPAFWSLPSLFLTETAAAGSIGLINSFGNLGGAVGPTMLGTVRYWTGSYLPGLIYLIASMMASATIIMLLGLGHRAEPLGQGRTEVPVAEPMAEAEADAMIEPA